MNHDANDFDLDNLEDMTDPEVTYFLILNRLASQSVSNLRTLKSTIDALLILKNNYRHEVDNIIVTL